MIFGSAAQAAKNVYTTIGAWKIIGITNPNGKLNRCAAEIAEPGGVMRLALSTDKKTWALSVPGTGPEMKLLTDEVDGEVKWSSNRSNESAEFKDYFKNDRAARRAWTTLASGVPGLDKATSLEVKLFDRANAAPGSKSRRFVWRSNDFGKALVATLECVKAY